MADKPSEYRVQHNGHEWLFPEVTLLHGHLMMARYPFLEASQEQFKVVDAGAGVGGFALALLESHPNAEFTMFEPWAECWPYLDFNMKDYGATVHKFALGKRDGSVPIGYKDKDRRIGKVSIGRHGTTAVPVKSLDSIYKEDRLDLFKIDVEGYELNVLQGAVETIKQYGPIILVEILKPQDDRSVFEFLHGLGYQAELKIWVNDYVFMRNS